MRVLIWVQHLMGSGHLRRAAAIAAALAADGAEVVVASGGLPVAGLVLGGARLLQLPPAMVRDADYSRLLDGEGREVDARWWQERRALLLGALGALRPELVVTETYPFGRGLLRAELEALLAAAARGGARLVASLRDIVEPRRQRAQRLRMIERAGRFARVLVHADPALVRLEASLPEAAALGGRLRYTGYVCGPLAAAGRERQGTGGPGGEPGEVLVSAGGGVAGEPLLRAALAAAATDPGRRWRLRAGPRLAASALARLRRAAPANVLLEPNRADFTERLAGCLVSVSQAGYNTVVEVLAARARAVLVPFAAGGEREQGIRARLLAGRGLAEHLEPAALSGASLAAAVTRAARAPRPPPGVVDLDGARRSAALLRELAGAGGSDR